MFIHQVPQRSSLVLVLKMYSRTKLPILYKKVERIPRLSGLSDDSIKNILTVHLRMLKMFPRRFFSTSTCMMLFNINDRPFFLFGRWGGEAWPDNLKHFPIISPKPVPQQTQCNENWENTGYRFTNSLCIPDVWRILTQNV